MPVKGRISKYYYFTVGLGLSAFMFYSIKFTRFSGKCVKTPTNDVLESLPKNDLLAEFLIVYLFLAIFSTVFAFPGNLFLYTTTPIPDTCRWIPLEKLVCLLEISLL